MCGCSYVCVYVCVEVCVGLCLQEFDGGSRGNGTKRSCAGAGAVLYHHDSNAEVRGNSWMIHQNN